MVTTHNAVTPLYHQITLVLRERIEAGYYGPEGRIPSELDLSKEFDVSRITVSRAINDLAQEGLVERRRGAGSASSTSWVSSRPSPPRPKSGS